MSSTIAGHWVPQPLLGYGAVYLAPPTYSVGFGQLAPSRFPEQAPAGGHPRAIPHHMQLHDLFRKRKLFPKTVTDVMRSWLQKNLEHPFPNEEDKERLCAQTGLSYLQLNYWFINARRRILPGLLERENKQRRLRGLPPIKPCKPHQRLTTSTTTPTAPTPKVEVGESRESAPIPRPRTQTHSSEQNPWPKVKTERVHYIQAPPQGTANAFELTSHAPGTHMPYLSTQPITTRPAVTVHPTPALHGSFLQAPSPRSWHHSPTATLAPTPPTHAHNIKLNHDVASYPARPLCHYP